MIYIRPHGGLCNVIYALLSTYALSKHTECSFLYERTPFIPLGYDEIFDTRIVENIDSWDTLYRGQITDIVQRYTIDSFLNIDGDMVIDSCCRFIPFDDELFKLIKFKQEYVDISKSINMYDNIIGVHIRRSDFITYGFPISPTDGFIKYMNDELTNDPTVKFFVSTDDKNTEDYILSLFGKDTIITHSKNNGYNRQSKLYVKDGVIDLLCLSYCKKIYGSEQSTFSEVASILNNAELIIV